MKVMDNLSFWAIRRSSRKNNLLDSFFNAIFYNFSKKIVQQHQVSLLEQSHNWDYSVSIPFRSY